MNPGDYPQPLPRTFRGAIVAMTQDRVIGVDGKLPWHYPADLKRFKRLTSGTTIIMGRATYESIGRPLPNRRNLVISQTTQAAGVETFASIDSALATCDQAVWFIGGARIFNQAFTLCDVIDVTWVPDHITAPQAVRFPAIPPELFAPTERVQHPDDPRLQIQAFVRTLALKEPLSLGS